MSPNLLPDLPGGCLTSIFLLKSVLSDVWNRFSALGLAGNHDSPTFRHTLQLLQFTLQMETGTFTKTPGKLCFSPRPNPESRFDEAFNCIVIREVSFVSDTRFQLFFVHECNFNTDFILGYSQRPVGFVLSAFSLL
jgi:hypothetical protein